MGLGADVQPSWEFDDVTARARLMRTVGTGQKTRWFLFLSPGYMAINEKQKLAGTTMKYSISMPTVALGVGFEKLYGFKKNKGWGMELGYQYGSADYTLKYSFMGMDQTYNGTYDASPLYLGFTWAYYFGK